MDEQGQATSGHDWSLSVEMACVFIHFISGRHDASGSIWVCEEANCQRRAARGEEAGIANRLMKMAAL